MLTSFINYCQKSPNYPKAVETANNLGNAAWVFLSSPKWISQWLLVTATRPFTERALAKVLAEMRQDPYNTKRFAHLSYGQIAEMMRTSARPDDIQYFEHRKPQRKLS